MKFVNEDILLTFNNLPSMAGNQAYTYILKQNGNPVFTGAAYKNTGQVSISVDVTQIIQSLHYDNDCMEKPLKRRNAPVPSGIADNFNASLYIGQNIYSSNTERVNFAYEYPHYVTGIHQCPFYDPTMISRNMLNNMLQGTDANHIQQILLPHIPYISTDEYGFGTVYQMYNTPSPHINFTNKLSGSIALNASTNTNIYYDTLRYIYAAANIYNQQECLGAGYVLIPGGVTGHGRWNSPKEGSIENTKNTSVGINFCDKNGNILKTVSTVNIPYDKPVTVTAQGTGCDDFTRFMIGTSDDNIYYDIKPGLEPLLESPSREFALKFNVQKKENGGLDVYIIDSLAILNLSYNDKSYGTLNLNNYPIAIIDECPADWYLEWIDRYGSFQSQPFYQKTKYTESFDYLEIKNYAGVRRKTYFNTQGAFQLNSGWLKDTVYPIYESIYTSPYLLLYDVKNNKSYNVICTDKTYEEKKFIGKREVINLQLNLEINKSQSKIY